MSLELLRVAGDHGVWAYVTRDEHGQYWLDPISYRGSIPLDGLAIQRLIRETKSPKRRAGEDDSTWRERMERQRDDGTIRVRIKDAPDVSKKLIGEVVITNPSSNHNWNECSQALWTIELIANIEDISGTTRSKAEDELY